MSLISGINISLIISRNYFHPFNLPLLCVASQWNSYFHSDDIRESRFGNKYRTLQNQEADADIIFQTGKLMRIIIIIVNFYKVHFIIDDSPKEETLETT